MHFLDKWKTSEKLIWKKILCEVCELFQLLSQKSLEPLKYPVFALDLSELSIKTEESETGPKITHPFVVFRNISLRETSIMSNVLASLNLYFSNFLIKLFRVLDQEK